MNRKSMHLPQTSPQLEVADSCSVKPAGNSDAPPTGLAGQTIRTALVLACMTRDLVRSGTASSDGFAVFRALQYASVRILHWVKQARRCGQHAARLKCLAEAACTNMAFRGLLYEEEPSGRLKPRRREMLLNRSRQLGAMIGRLCESVGRTAAADSVHESLGADGPVEWEQTPKATESPYCFRG